jgi:hypothetical protein
MRIVTLLGGRSVSWLGTLVDQVAEISESGQQ